MSGTFSIVAARCNTSGHCRASSLDDHFRLLSCLSLVQTVHFLLSGHFPEARDLKSLKIKVAIQTRVCSKQRTLTKKALREFPAGMVVGGDLNYYLF
jgi:hypothetical protein